MTWAGLYLGCDPGKRTGLAWLFVDETGIALANYHDVPNGVDGFIEWWDERKHVMQDWNVTCVYESFTLREGKYGVDITPRDVIGALKALATRDGVDLIERPPAARLKQMPDRVMKKIGMYLPGKQNRNAREAVRHVLSYLKSQRHPEVLKAFRG